MLEFYHVVDDDGPENSHYSFINAIVERRVAGDNVGF